MKQEENSEVFVNCLVQKKGLPLEICVSSIKGVNIIEQNKTNWLCAPWE